jgi:hypothetical protein
MVEVLVSPLPFLTIPVSMLCSSTNEHLRLHAVFVVAAAAAAAAALVSGTRTLISMRAYTYQHWRHWRAFTR